MSTTRSARAKKPFIFDQLRGDPRASPGIRTVRARKGAFTGAVARRIGNFEEATGGTLLLDEISEMDVRLQSKLLRAIQERVIDRVGAPGRSPVRQPHHRNFERATSRRPCAKLVP